MICALCGRDKELRGSHIIPEFVYRQLYDSKHRFHILSTGDKHTRTFEQKGVREELLCERCEQKFSVHERYARGVLLGGTEIVVRHRGEYLELSGLDYKKFKLFQLSILWRAGVAKHPMFSRVKLGPHEQKLRQMLNEDNPGRPDQYCCVVIGLRSEEEIQMGFIDQPTRLRIDGHTVYRFIFAGFMWVYFVSSHAVPGMFRHVVLNEKGEMKVSIGRFEDLGYLREFVRELHKKDRFPKPTEVV